MKKILISSIIILAYSLVISCVGQVQTNGKEDNNDSGESIMSQPYEWVDPMFVHEDQLCQHLRCMYEDSNGNLWFGTNVYNLMRYDGDSLIYLLNDPEEGAPRFNGILEDDEGHVWFASYGGLIEFDGNTFINHSERCGIYEPEFMCMTRTKAGDILLGSHNGVRRFDGQNFHTWLIPKAKIDSVDPYLSHEGVTSILEDSRGNLWFGTDGYGLTKYDGNSYTHFTKEDGLPDNFTGGLYEDVNGNIWISTMLGGISIYDGKRFRNLLEEGVIQGTEVSGVYEDKSGNIWFSVEHEGIYKFDGESFTLFEKEKNGLDSAGIMCFLEDSEGRFWVGGWMGLFRFYPESESFEMVTKDGPWE